MPTSDEIDRRVKQIDLPRSEKRSVLARQVGELAQHRNAIAEQLCDIERRLSDLLMVAREVMDIPELAQFTDVPVADLTRWLDIRTDTKTGRKRKRPSGPAGQINEAPSVSTRTNPLPASTPPDTAASRARTEVA